jgi:uncharacterized membrane protein
MSESPGPASNEATADLLGAERLKAFTDAVVAIAMTLLILPLMDSVGQAMDKKLTAWDWVSDEHGAILTFALSFVLIANFWLIQHRLFGRIDRTTPMLLWLTLLWMFTIVWLPVATALTGLEHDATQKVMYIGGLSLTSLVLLVIQIYVGRHPELHSIPPHQQRHYVANGVAVFAMFLVALAVALLFPVLNYWPMALLALAPVLGRFIVHGLRSRDRHPS